MNVDRLLLVHSTVNGEYKFPGGGARRGERHHVTLARELREETGYQLQAVNQLLGTTIEMDIPLSGRKQPFRMISFYYLCEISPEKGAPEPDAYEYELGFQPRWVTLPKALTNNELLMHTAAAKRVFWLARETAVLQQLSTLFPGKSALRGFSLTDTPGRAL